MMSPVIAQKLVNTVVQYNKNPKYNKTMSENVVKSVSGNHDKIKVSAFGVSKFMIFTICILVKGQYNIIGSI